MEDVNIKISVIWSYDRDAKCHICYSGKYDICGYGETRKDALNMFKSVVLMTLELSKPI